LPPCFAPGGTSCNAASPAAAESILRIGRNAPRHGRDRDAILVRDLSNAEPSGGSRSQTKGTPSCLNLVDVRDPQGAREGDTDTPSCLSLARVAEIISDNAPSHAHKKLGLAMHRARTLGIPTAYKKVVDSRTAAAGRPRLVAARRRVVGAVHNRTPPVGGMRRRQETGRRRRAAVVVRAKHRECQRLSPRQAQNQSPLPL
jgi:hypothetical protein